MAASCRSVRWSNPAASCAATETSEDEVLPELPDPMLPMPPIIIGAPIMALRFSGLLSRLGSVPGVAEDVVAADSVGVRLGSSGGVPVLLSPEPRSGRGSGEDIPPPMSSLPVSGGRSGTPLPVDPEEPLLGSSRLPSD